MSLSPAHLISRFSLTGWLVCLTLVLGIMLGGSARSGFLADTLLQLASLPLLLIALFQIWDARTPRRIKLASAACCLPLACALLQLIQLAPTIWTRLPPAAVYLEAFSLTGLSPHAMAMSVDPGATALTALSLLPAMAIFAGTLLLDRHERRRATIALLAIGFVSALLGILQVAQGPGSPLRFFPYTNPGEAVGFFANRNHFAALTYVMVLFVAVLATLSVNARDDAATNDPRNPVAVLVPALGWFTGLVVLLAALALTRSRAGLILCIVALLGAFVLAMATPRSTQRSAATWLITGSVLGAVMLSSQFVLFRLFERFSTDPLGDSRFVFARTTARAARAFMPFGSGFGTFVPVYASFEQPQDTIGNIYANHAHNDLFEVWLESGVAGLVLMAAFAVWLIVRGVSVWRQRSTRADEVDAALVRAAFIAILLLGAHSLVDYPLRTGAMMMVMAFCCALLIEPALQPLLADAATQRSADAIHRDVTAHARSSPAPSQPWSPGAQTPAAKPRVLWGNQTEWPDAWTQKPGPPETARDPVKPQPFPTDWTKKPPGRES